MSWFRRNKQGITTTTVEKKETPEGLWYKCPQCKKISSAEDHKQNKYVCLHCSHHQRIGSAAYYELLFDNNEYTEINENVIAADPLNFHDTKKYSERIQESISKTSLNDAMRTAWGSIGGKNVMVACMDFTFIGGSMGAVMGEKISSAIDFCIDKKMPLLIISKSGGARMMEGAYSLMQMAKTSAKLTMLSDAQIPFISLLTDPTTGGVTASYAMLGDLNISEPSALIGFAGPRVVKETIGKDLPKGFQTAEFVLEHGFLDFIVDRRELKAKITQLVQMFEN